MQVGRARRIREIYRRHNATRGADFIYGGEERVTRIRQALPAAPTLVLDLGCRDGALAHALGLDPARTVGVDIDLDALRTARGSARLRPVACDLWAGLPFKDGTFDVVLAGEILEHVPFPEVVLEEARRVLREGGVLVGSVPNAFRLKNRLRFLFGRPFEDDPTHLHHFSPATLFCTLERYFEEVSVKPCVGRLARFAPQLTSNDLVFFARRSMTGDG
ncbi:MAG: methyltransferase domain-containing protein [Armatimonadota bacterium]|nr:methyltransferase domain-containing protein [Armatimonadota bacterium]